MRSDLSSRTETPKDLKSLGVSVRRSPDKEPLHLFIEILKAMINQNRAFCTIPEREAFLDLFPHRWDYIHSPYSHGMGKIQWRTESRHTLSDRVILEGAKYYGVRFGPETAYTMIDIDSGSLYHPRHDPFAIHRIMDALEPLGLVHSIAITSSSSGGLHLYFPFPTEISTWKVSEAIDLTLRAAGFCLKGGELEIFPNLRTGDRLLYAAHRLPLQDPKSWILNADFQPIYTTRSEFVSRWIFCSNQNTVTIAILKAAIAVHARRCTKLSTTAHKFLGDLECEVTPGWTGRSQTNHLLGRIVLLGYCFGHVIEDLDRPMHGERLVDWSIEKARSLPGFKEFCRHQAGLRRRVRDWCRSCESNSRYFPYAIGKSSKPSDLISDGRSQNAWNILQRQLAETRINHAIDRLVTASLNGEDRSAWEAMTIDDWVQYLRSSGMSLETLYRHKDLWHPAHRPHKIGGNLGSSLISFLSEIDRKSLSGAGFNVIALQIYHNKDRKTIGGAGSPLLTGPND